MHKLGIIGQEELVVGWHGLGIYTVSIEEKDEVEDKLKQAIRDGCKIIFISEDFIQPIFDRIEEISEKENITISIVPGKEMLIGKQSPFSLKRMKRYIEKAIGADVLGEL